MKLPLYLRRVVGHSMQPTLVPDQIVLVSHWLKPRLNDLVVAKIGGREVIKRIAKIGKRQVVLVGDNPAHAYYATIQPDNLLGRVILSA